MILRPNFIPIYRYQPETPAYNAVLASGALSRRSYQHLDKFIRDCKEAGVWSLLTFCMPFISDGGVTNAFLTDIVAARTVTAVNFVGGDASEATGLTGDGATKYLNLGGTVAGLLSANDCHMAAYVRADNAQAGNRLLLGAGDASHVYFVGSLIPASQCDARAGQLSTATATGQFVKGFYHSQRISATDLKLYRNGAQIGTSSANTTGVPNAINIFAAAWNSNGTPAGYINTPISFLSIGASMTPQQITDYYAIVQTLQTNLGRAV